MAQWQGSGAVWGTMEQVMRCGIIEVEGGSANDNGHNICECDNGDGNINHGNVTIKTMPAAIKQKECR